MILTMGIGKTLEDPFIVGVIEMRGAVMLAYRIEIEVARYKIGLVRGHATVG